MTTTPVPYDPELTAGLTAFQALFEPFPLRADTIIASREHITGLIPPLQEQIGDLPVLGEDRLIPGPVGSPEVAVSIIRPKAARPDAAPAVLGIHGGGMVLGTRFFGTGELIDLAHRHGIVGVAVEYRLAPEHRGPAAAEDCYAALEWMAANAAGLGIDPERLIVSGASAGGGLSASVALMARDRGGPRLAGQLLNTPMLDDRNETVSSRQYEGIGVWDRNNNAAGWDAVLGNTRGTGQVSPYSAAARAPSLAGLPPAFIEVGAAEVFRDEAIAYASRIWSCGGSAELHVWSGAYHGFSGFSPDANVSRAARAARESWLCRTLGLGPAYS